MKACATCGGQLVDRDLDYGAICLQCSRPAVKPEPPAWLLYEDEPGRIINFELRRRRLTLRRAAESVTDVTLADMRAAMAVLR